MIKKDDKLKRLLSWSPVSTWPEEVRVGNYISPVANIKVVWVGWGWNNAVNRMIQSSLDGVEFIAINTDSQALFSSMADKKINIWRATTSGLWAWANPEIWKKAAEESSEEIKAALDGADMVFITCGLWGWTWSWAAPVVAEIAKSLGALTVWVVTKPFAFEWQSRSSKALDAYNNLRDKVDTLITIPNDRILTIIDKKTPLLDAFSIVDEVLREWVQGVSDLITQPGLINVDFADVKSVMKNAWSALMGIWYGSWENRAVEAARSAIDSPLLELSIAWAKGLLFNITGWTDLSMFEVDEAAKIITESVDRDANIIFGTTINDDYTWELKITVVATGFDEESNKNFSQTSATSKMSPFGRKSVSDTRPSNTWFSNQNQAQPRHIESSWDDLDVPAFLRKKI
jgi:cell division protein FtsZ